MCNDFFLGLICWLVFGPPMATYIASEFSTGIFDSLFREWKSFIVPIMTAMIYLYVVGFYKSLIKFFDSKDSIFISLVGSLIFGGSWALLHVYQFQIVSTTFLSIALLQGFLLAAVFYAFLNNFFSTNLKPNIPTIFFSILIFIKDIYHSILWSSIID